MKHEPLTAISREVALSELSSGDGFRMSEALTRVALFEPDRRWAEDRVVEAMEQDDPWLLGVATTCAGHIARTHRRLDTERIVPMLRSLLRNQEVAGRAQDALDDIEVYLGPLP